MARKKKNTSSKEEKTYSITHQSNTKNNRTNIDHNKHVKGTPMSDEDHHLKLGTKVNSTLHFSLPDADTVSPFLIQLTTITHETLCQFWQQHHQTFYEIYVSCPPELFRSMFNEKLGQAIEVNDCLEFGVKPQDLLDVLLLDLEVISRDLNNNFENYEQHKSRLLQLMDMITSSEEWWTFDEQMNKPLYQLIEQKHGHLSKFKVMRRCLMSKVFGMFMQALFTHASGDTQNMYQQQQQQQYNESICHILEYARQTCREKNRFDLTTDIAYNDVLRLYRKHLGASDESLNALYLAFFYNPTVIYHLLEYVSKPCKHSISDYEGYCYAQKMRRAWKKTTGSIKWLKDWLSTPCTVRDCSYHAGCMEFAAELKRTGNEKFAANDFIGAIEFYTRAIATIMWDEYPEKATYYSNRALCFAKLNDHESVVEDCTHALILSPNHSKSLLRRALSYEALGKNDFAVRDLKALQDLEPTNKTFRDVLERLFAKLPQPHEQLMEHQKVKQQGNIKYKQGEFKEALKLYTRALSVCPIDNMDLAVLYCNRAACHYQLGDHSNCIEDCTTSIAINPCYFRARVRRASSYEKEKLLIHALNDLNIAKRINQNNSEVLSILQRVSKRIDEIDDEVYTFHMKHGKPQEPNLATITNQLDTLAESMSRTWVMKTKRKLPKLIKFWELLSDKQRDEIVNFPKESVLLRMEKMNNFVEIALFEAAILMEAPHFLKSLRHSFESALRNEGKSILPPDIHFGPWIDGSAKDTSTVHNPCASFEYDTDLNQENRLVSGFLRLANDGKDIRYHCQTCDKFRPWYNFYRVSIKRAEHCCMYCKMNVPEQLASLGYMDDAKHKITLKRLQSMDTVFHKDNSMVEDMAYQNTYVVYTSCLNTILDRLEKAVENPPKNIDPVKMRALFTPKQAKKKMKAVTPVAPNPPPSSAVSNVIAQMTQQQQQKQQLSSGAPGAAIIQQPQQQQSKKQPQATSTTSSSSSSSPSSSPTSTAANPFQQHMKCMLEDMQLNLFSVLREKGSGFANAIEGMKPRQTTGVCIYCHKSDVEAGSLKRCSVCKAVFYCSVNCQRKHWPDHKIVCLSLPKFERIVYDIKNPMNTRELLLPALDACMLLAERNSHYRKLMTTYGLTQTMITILERYKDDEEMKRFAAKILFYLAHTRKGKIALKSNVHFIMGIASKWAEEQQSAAANGEGKEDIPLSSMLLQTALAVVSDDNLVIE